MIGQTISNCRVVEKLALWIRATLRNVWNRAGLILALSFVLVASAQNLRSPLPRGPVPPNSTQDPVPVAASPQLPHVFPPHSQSFLAGEYGPTQRKSTAGISTQSQLFLDTSAPQYETGSYPASVAIGDFNGDGRPDVAVTSEDFLSVLLGNGDGTFLTCVDVAIGSRSVVVGDFNGDDKADLAFTNSGDSVGVLLGNGDCTFQTEADFAVGPTPTSLAIGDFNGDGKADLVTANSGNTSVSVLLGNGDGTFRTHVDYATGSYPTSVAVGDLNGDGKADLAVTSVDYDLQSHGVSVLLGSGDGTFKTHVDSATIGYPSSVAIGDFNGDGKPDLAATSDDNSVNVLLGNGDGTFRTQVDYPTASRPTSVAIGDFNGDGKIDLAATISDNNSVSVLLGNGDGTFQDHMDYATGTYPTSLATGDFNGDGKPDFVITNFYNDSVSVLLGDGDGTFPNPPRYATGNSPTSVAVGDFNGDGKADLAVPSFDLGLSSVGVLLGNGDGTFQTHMEYATGQAPMSVAIGDFNGDGKADLVTANSGTTSVSVLLGNGDGTFRAHVDYATGSYATSVAVSDFNGDGKADLAVTVMSFADNTVNVLLGNGDGTFQTHVEYPTGSHPTSVAVGDFNGDGKADLVTTNAFDNSVSVLLGNGDGTFQTHVDYATAGDPSLVAIGDFNGDGKPDFGITTSGNLNPSVSVLLGNGDGTFQTHMDFLLDPIEYGPMSLAIGDFNADGKADLAVADSLESVNVLLGNGDGTFQTGVQYARGQGYRAIAVADFNGDGALDLAFLTPWNAVGILLNIRGTVVGLQSSSNPSTFGKSVILTATVFGYGIGIPSGTVMFWDGTEALGSETLSVGGAATLSVGTLKAGTHSITAVYSGDDKFNAGTSEVLNQIVEPVQDFGISATPTVATATVGSSVDFAVTATALNGFNSTVSLSCSVSPTPTFAPTCGLVPTSIAPANGSATSKLTVTTIASTASLHPIFHDGASPLYALWLPIFALAVLGVGFGSDRLGKKKVSASLLAALVVVGLGFQAACGGSSYQSGSSGTLPGQYTVTVNATSGAIAHTAVVTITVQ